VISKICVACFEKSFTFPFLNLDAGKEAAMSIPPPPARLKIQTATFFIQSLRGARKQAQNSRLGPPHRKAHSWRKHTMHVVDITVIFGGNSAGTRIHIKELELMRLLLLLSTSSG
jgi:hypothetical protein